MKKASIKIVLLILVALLASCTTRELDLGYGRPCFNSNNELVYIKVHSYFHWNLTYLLGAEVYDYYTYLCYMDLEGNEEVDANILVGIQKLSEGNGIICIQTGEYDAYVYRNRELEKIPGSEAFEVPLLK